MVSLSIYFLSVLFFCTTFLYYFSVLFFCSGWNDRGRELTFGEQRRGLIEQGKGGRMDWVIWRQEGQRL